MGVSYDGGVGICCNGGECVSYDGGVGVSCDGGEGVSCSGRKVGVQKVGKGKHQSVVLVMVVI